VKRGGKRPGDKGQRPPELNLVLGIDKHPIPPWSGVDGGKARNNKVVHKQASYEAKRKNGDKLQQVFRLMRGTCRNAGRR